MKRPAEKAGAAAGVGGVIAGVATSNWLAVVTALAGAFPAAVTYVVANGGVKGILESIWGGRRA